MGDALARGGGHALAHSSDTVSVVGRYQGIETRIYGLTQLQFLLVIALTNPMGQASDNGRYGDGDELEAYDHQSRHQAACAT